MVKLVKCLKNPMLTILVDSPDRVKRRMKETHSNGDKEEVYNVAGIL
jgi:hypothetical protein